MQHRKVVLLALFVAVLLSMAMGAELPGRAAKAGGKERETGAAGPLLVLLLYLLLSLFRLFPHHFLDLRRQVGGVMALHAVLLRRASLAGGKGFAGRANSFLVFALHPAMCLCQMRVQENNLPLLADEPEPGFFWNERRGGSRLAVSFCLLWCCLGLQQIKSGR